MAMSDDVISIQAVRHLGMQPDHQHGAFQNCFCGECQEARLRDDERIIYGARDLARAYEQGYRDAIDRVARRLSGVADRPVPVDLGSATPAKKDAAP
jgi:hypothetical protein